jgi:hypothetical protein
VNANPSARDAPAERPKDLGQRISPEGVSEHVVALAAYAHPLVHVGLRERMRKQTDDREKLSLTDCRINDDRGKR